MVNWKEIELGFRTNPNKSWCLVCVWVITHIRMILGEINGRVLKEDKNWKKIPIEKRLQSEFEMVLMCV